MAKTDWHSHAEAVIKRLAARWHATTSLRLAMDGDDVAQELWVTALAAERQRPGHWRVAVRRDFANLIAKEMRRNNHANVIAKELRRNKYANLIANETRRNNHV